MPPSRRDDLIDAAMRVFYRQGFHGTGIEKVLQEASVSRMTLYNHFKSKDELIVAALRRRDEIFRNRMMQFVEGRRRDPVERILAIFDFLEEWFDGNDFCGCMFINAAAEYGDPDCPIRRVAADHKREVLRYLRKQCASAGLTDPNLLADLLSILIEGAIVTAQVVGNVTGRARIDGAEPTNAARLAKQAAQRLIETAQAA